MSEPAQNGFKKQENGKAANERRHWVYIMLLVVIVFILLLMTLGILALRVENYLPEGTDIVFVVGKSPSVEFGDEKGSWKSGLEVDIFKSYYENDQQVVTVLSKEGDSLIAPGTQMQYYFIAYNKGNIAVTYETDIDFLFESAGQVKNDFAFPLKVRLKTDSGKYLIGGESEWVDISTAKVTKHVSVLGASSYEGFTLELIWAFEGGDDALDTMLGNMSANGGAKITLGIETYAEEHFEPTAQGGIVVEAEDGKPVEHGGTIRYFWLMLLFICIAILVFFIAWLLNKRLRKW